MGHPDLTYIIPLVCIGLNNIILDNPGVTHSVPTAFMNAVGKEWVTPGLPRMNNKGDIVFVISPLNSLRAAQDVSDEYPKICLNKPLPLSIHNIS